MIKVKDSGDFKKTIDSLNKILKGNIFDNLDFYGQMGVDALARVTPVNSGLLEHSWSYRIVQDVYGPTIEWINTDIENGLPVAILIQYGHGTRNGGYIQGIDYINPAIQEVFDKIVQDLWEKVKA